MIYLRQSTASQIIPLGRFVSSADGDTEMTALTILASDIWLWKNGASSLVGKNSGGGTHMNNGEYRCTLDAQDTNTIGPMKITIHVSTALYVQVFCSVLAAAQYDVIFGTTAISTLDAAGVRTAVGLAAANTDTQLAALSTSLGTVPTANQNADALLGRNVAGGSSTGQIVSEALYHLRCAWNISSNILTVKDPNGNVSWTRPVHVQPGAQPITGLT